MKQKNKHIIGAGLLGMAAWLLLRPKKNSTMVTDLTLPRGYRNNNPGNIRINSANNWLGKVSPNTDGVFEQFSSMTYGYRAMMILIRNYIKQGYITVADIISRWAPKNENHTEKYINYVCNATGFAPKTVIDPGSKLQMTALVRAIAKYENGKNHTTYEDSILAAWKMSN